MKRFFLIGIMVPNIICAVAPNTVIATINVGVTPDGIAITDDNAHAYVANNNNYGVTGQDGFSVLDLVTNMLEQTITNTTLQTAIFNQPFTITINPAGTKAYVTNSNGSTVTIVNIPANTIAGTITGFDGPSGMVITPNGQFGYVNNYGGPDGVQSGNGTTVSVVNLSTNTIVATITTSQAPAALAINSQGTYVYVINYVDGNPGTGTLQAIRTSDNTIGATLSGLSGPFGITVTPDNKYAYIANFGSNNFVPFGTTVSVVDLNSMSIVATVPVGIQPSGIAVTPDGKYVYVANFNSLYSTTTVYDGNTEVGSFLSLNIGQGTINIIDTATNTVLPPTIAVGLSPSHIAISPNGEFAYVTNFASNTVSVIALQSFYITAQGKQIRNRYLTQNDLVNRITWTVVGTSLPISYSIYRDAQLTDLAGTVLATEPFVFLDHNRKQGVSYTYYIIGTNRVGTTSEPVIVTIR